MSDIDFQNGFVVGMATKGLIKSGQAYSPIIGNDTGLYSYFYIDFLKTLSLFSLPMLIDGIQILTSSSTVITITGFTQITGSKYKIFTADFSAQETLTVVGKPTTWLNFSTDGTKVPGFSQLFYIAGITPIFRPGYFIQGIDTSVYLSPAEAAAMVTTNLTTPYLETPVSASKTDSINSEAMLIAATNYTVSTTVTNIVLA